MRRFLVALGLLVTSCAVSSPIQRYSASESNFSDPPVLIGHNHPDCDVYRIYHQGATGFVSIESIRADAERRAEEFARRQSRSFTVLGEKTSSPPYILGNFPRIEIVFALIDTPKSEPDFGVGNRYAELEKLKQLFDKGALTQEEFEREKARTLKALEDMPRSASTAVVPAPPSASTAVVPAPISASTTEAVIETRIDGSFEGFEYGRLFKLLNGQIWEQTSFEMNLSLKLSPRVMLFQSNGVWKMKVDGVDRLPTVQRLR